MGRVDRALCQGSRCIWYEGLIFKMEGGSYTDGWGEILLTPICVPSSPTSPPLRRRGTGLGLWVGLMERQLLLAPSSQQLLMMNERSCPCPSTPVSFSPVSVKMLGGTGELWLSAPAALSASPPSSCPLCSHRKPAVTPICLLDMLPLLISLQGLPPLPTIGQKHRPSQLLFPSHTDKHKERNTLISASPTHF